MSRHQNQKCLGHKINPGKDPFVPLDVDIKEQIYISSQCGRQKQSPTGDCITADRNQPHRETSCVLRAQKQLQIWERW